ncbi:hypothetical protein EZV62_017291 [Acer yangbiense]|uniref:DUF7788 domain-containing protein n=1 Tax=Acer yangbiense TaxID=1000413 RepID=A0A5C7HGT3_9ROSI|nr:hypothetical protein EZV62_017291 [Acer yangbiense]
MARKTTSEEVLARRKHKHTTDLIVQVAGNLKPEQMIKRPFVFIVMEFDQASPNPWDTDYQAIVRKYTEKGYGLAVPEMTICD